MKNKNEKYDQLLKCAFCPFKIGVFYSALICPLLLMKKLTDSS